MRQLNGMGLLWGVITVIGGLVPSDVQADPRIRGGISFGSGGVRIGIGSGPMYGPGFGGYGYGPGFGGYGPGYGYRPAPVFVQPYPVYQPQPVFVQPQPVYVQPQPQYLPQPTYAHESSIPTAPTPLADGGEIMLFSPATNLGDIRYTLNGHPYTMAPGTKQKFKNDRTWTIEFESSPGRFSQYTLSSTRYKFKPSDAGLGLFQTQDVPESVPAPIPAAPIPEAPTPAEPTAEETVIPQRPALKATP
jgi:hypothetical protein